MSNVMKCDICGKEIPRHSVYFVLRRTYTIDEPKTQGEWDLCSHRCLDAQVIQLSED